MNKRTFLISVLSLLFFFSGDIAVGQNNNRKDVMMENPYVHDPVMARCGNKYYMFCTGNGISMLSSDDMKTWRFEDPVFSEPPVWAKEAVKGYRGHTWAPDIIFHNGLYYLYYSCSAFGKNTSVIGVTVNKTLDTDSPDYKWEDKGMVLQSVPNRDMWNAIDPNVIIDGEGVAWMSFGSFWDGLKLVRLDETMTRLAEPQEWYPLCRRERDFTLEDVNPGNGAVEAAFIFKKGNFYYLFASFDYCCRGAKSDYKVMVGRSESVKGPYLDRDGKSMSFGGGSLVVAGNKRYAGVGHSATVTFDGKDYLVMHGYDMTQEGRSVLLVREIKWDAGGWPDVSLE